MNLTVKRFGHEPFVGFFEEGSTVAQVIKLVQAATGETYSGFNIPGFHPNWMPVDDPLLKHIIDGQFPTGATSIWLRTDNLGPGYYRPGA